MAYFVTGATGFIGRHLVQELLDNRDGEIFVLVRKGSRGRLDHLLRSWGNPTRVTAVTGDLTAPNLGVSKTWVREHRGDIEHFFHVAALYDMTASDELNEELNVGGTRSALDLAAALDAGVFHQVSSIAASGDYHGDVRRDHVRRGSGPAVGLPPDEVRVRADRARGVDRAVAGLPARGRGRALRDRLDGQDRRSLLLLLAVQAAARQPARVDADRRRRPRRHQRGAGRLRRQGDGPHRPPARPRRAGLPPGQPRPPAHRRRGEHPRRPRRRHPASPCRWTGG